MKSTTMLCKCWRVKDYEVILISLSIKVFERILAECLMTRIIRELSFINFCIFSMNFMIDNTIYSPPFMGGARGWVFYSTYSTNPFRYSPSG